MRAVAKFPELCLRIWFGRTSKKCSGSWNWPYTMASCSHVAICCHALPCYATVCFAPSTAGLGIERFSKCASHCLPKLWMLGAFAYSSMRQCREDRNPRCATGGWLCTCSQTPRNASRVVRQGELLLNFCFGQWRFQIKYAELCPGQRSAAMLQWVNHHYIRIFLSRWGQLNFIIFCYHSWFLRISVPATSWYPSQTRYKHVSHVVSPKTSPGALWDAECRTYCRTRCSLPGQDVLLMKALGLGHIRYKLYLLNYLTAACLKNLIGS